MTDDDDTVDIEPYSVSKGARTEEEAVGKFKVNNILVYLIVWSCMNNYIDKYMFASHTVTFFNLPKAKKQLFKGGDDDAMVKPIRCEEFIIDDIRFQVRRKTISYTH